MKTFLGHALRSLLLAAGLGLAVAPSASAALLYTESFDDGVADGFTLSSLWHVTTNFPAGGTSALGYVQNETPSSGTPDGDYTVATLAATAFGPLFAIPTDGTTTLSFDVFVGDEFDIEPNTFDQFSVWASLDGASLSALLASSEPSAGGVAIPEWGGTAAYNAINVDLTSFAGQDIFLAYHFDAIDGAHNNYPGVRVDNISVDNCGDGPVIPEPSSLLLMGMGGLAVGWRRRRRAF